MVLVQSELLPREAIAIDNETDSFVHRNKANWYFLKVPLAHIILYFPDFLHTGLK